jgi:outer membrane protein assembly factor BamD
MKIPARPSFTAAVVVLQAALFLGAVGCAKKAKVTPASKAPDAAKYLFDRGTEALNARKWIKAREYFKEIVENYPQSPYRPDAKLGVGDTYLGENNTETLLLAANEFKEFLTFFPLHRRADYAQYKLGLSHFEQMLGPERDQTQTKEAITEFQTFIDRYPNSSLLAEGRKKVRQARDRLSDYEYGVGYSYFRFKWYPGAVDRLKTLLKSDPEYTHRDAAYFYLAESLVALKLQAEALPYYERLVAEFQASKFLVKANLRISELKKGAPG